MRIMIVDDSAAFREATRHLLSKNPIFEVVAEAENGKRAVEIFEEQKLDLILMDIEMPIMNGIEATKQILKTGNHVKIIAVSAYQEKIYLNNLLDIGFIAYVNKNNVFDQLKEVINSVSTGKNIHIKKHIVTK